MKTLIFTFLTLFSLNNTYANETILCTHPQVCNLARSITVTPEQFKIVKGLEGLNPHHSSPSIKIYKILKKANTVLYAPLQLEPWFKGYESQNKNSYRIHVNNNHSHFWLHPESLCQAEKQLHKHFTSINLKTQKKETSFCDLKLSKTNNKQFFVLTHDSLKQLLIDMGHEVFVINTHDEHHDLSPKTLKRLTKLIKSQQSVKWILETQFHHPKVIKKMIKKNHKTLTINTIGKLDQSPNALLLEIMNFVENK